MNLQNQLANFSFLTLLGSMIFYWIGTSFSNFSLVKGFEKREDNISNSLSNQLKASSYSASSAILSSQEVNKVGLEEMGAKPETQQVGSQKGFIQNLAKYGMVLSNIFLGLLLLLRWKESGHFPLSNLYESLMFLSWCFTVIHLVIENYTFSTLSTTFLNKRQMIIPNLFGAITTPSALLTNAFATFTLPKEMQEVGPLVPALQSNWLMMHVTVMILSYAALIVGSLLSIAFLIVTLPKPTAGSLLFKNQTNTESNLSTDSVLTPLALTLDNLSYRILGIGFPFLTIGILSGAVWANEAWGSYWSWDPKETWALLTWLIFAIYLHTRISKGWEGKKPAIIASLGLIVVWICYLGVNLIGEGLHSYGWFS